MNLNVTGHDLKTPTPDRDYIATNMVRTPRHYDQVIDVNVILSVEKLVQKVEATIHVAGKDIFAESQDADMYAAIDSLADKLDRQVVKHKEKNGGHGRDALKHQAAE